MKANISTMLKHPETVTGMPTGRPIVTPHALLKRASAPEALLDEGAAAYLRLALETLAAFVSATGSIKSLLLDNLPVEVRRRMDPHWGFLDQLTGAAREFEPFALLAAEVDEERNQRDLVQDHASQLAGGFFMAMREEYGFPVYDRELVNDIIDGAAAEVDYDIADDELISIFTKKRGWLQSGVMNYEDTRAAASHLIWAYLSWKSFSAPGTVHAKEKEVLEVLHILLANLAIEGHRQEWTSFTPDSIKVPFDFDADILR